MHLPLAEAIIIQIIEAGIGQPGIKRSEIREIESVVYLSKRDFSPSMIGHLAL
jgi:hypothetical protein